MILIAESGSTKTHWVLLDGGEVVNVFTSTGLNPFTQSSSFISDSIKNEVITILPDSIKDIYFYGAGCSSEANCNLVRDSIKHYYPQANITIKHDILAAAVGLFGDRKGIAAILGTGSNSCYYNGSQIIEGVPALGYILGDEGGGAWLGKKLLTDYLYKKLPVRLEVELLKKYPLSKEYILNAVYKQPNPNRWLASFAPFFKENLQDEYCLNVVKQSFSEFFECHIMHFYAHRAETLGVVGSIGYFFKEILQQVSDDYGFKLEKVLQSPMDGLVEYYRNRS